MASFDFASLTPVLSLSKGSGRTVAQTYIPLVLSPLPFVLSAAEPFEVEGVSEALAERSRRTLFLTTTNGHRLPRMNAAGVLCLLLLSALLVAGCGRKGAPRAPGLAVPAAITDLTAQVEDRGIRLGWSRPRVALDGRALTALAAFVVFRKGTRADCPECRAAFRERAVLSVEDEGRFFRQSKYGFTDRELRAGTVYRYRVLVRLSDGSASGPSNEVSVEWQP